MFLQISHSDHSVVREMKEITLQKIDQYYGKGSDLGMLDKAKVLDPRFNNCFIRYFLLLELVEAASNTLSPISTMWHLYFGESVINFSCVFCYLRAGDLLTLSAAD